VRGRGYYLFERYFYRYFYGTFFKITGPKVNNKEKKYNKWNLPCKDFHIAYILLSERKNLYKILRLMKGRKYE
jgi:hypothetical protein